MSEAILSDNSIVREERQVKEWTPAKVIYTCLMAFNLLSFLWLLANGSGIEMPPIIGIARLATVPLAIYLGRLWKDKGFRILSIYFLWFLFRCIIPNSDNFFAGEVSQSILSALWLFSSCYGLARILTGDQTRKFLLTCSSIWLVGICIFSCIGIYTAWTDSIIDVNGHGVIGLYYSARLNMIYLSTTAGSILGLTFLIGIVTIVSAKKKLIKILLILVLFPIALAMALTDSRIVYISLPIGLGGFIFSYIFEKCKDKKAYGKNQYWRCWVYGIISMVITVILSFWLLMQIIPVFNIFKIRGLISTAYAEGAGKIPMIRRGLEGTDILNGRMEIWASVLNYLRYNPLILLIGESKLHPLQNVIASYSHCHNIYLQVLLESGIPGLLIFLSFIVYTFFQSMKTIATSTLRLSIRLIPAILVFLCIEDFAECFIWLRSSQCPMIAAFFICAGIIKSQQANKIQTYSKI